MAADGSLTNQVISGDFVDAHINHGTLAALEYVNTVHVFRATGYVRFRLEEDNNMKIRIVEEQPYVIFSNFINIYSLEGEKLQNLPQIRELLLKKFQQFSKELANCALYNLANNIVKNLSPGPITLH